MPRTRSSEHKSGYDEFANAKKRKSVRDNAVVESKMDGRGKPLVTPRYGAGESKRRSDGDVSSDREAPQAPRVKRSRRVMKAPACGKTARRPALACVDENSTLDGTSARKGPAARLQLCLGDTMERQTGDIASGCFTARGELDELKTYCPPDRKSKNVLFTPR